MTPWSVPTQSRPWQMRRLVTHRCFWPAERGVTCTQFIRVRELHSPDVPQDKLEGAVVRTWAPSQTSVSPCVSGLLWGHSGVMPQDTVTGRCGLCVSGPSSLAPGAVGCPFESHTQQASLQANEEQVGQSAMGRDKVEAGSSGMYQKRARAEPVNRPAARLLQANGWMHRWTDR